MVHTVWQGSIAVTAAGALAGVPVGEFVGEFDRLILLGELDGFTHWAVDRSTEDREVLLLELGAAHPEVEFRSLREAAPHLDVDHANVAAFAAGMAQWMAAHRCCPSCGAELRPQLAGHELRCNGCSTVHWPRTDPAVIMLVVDGDRCLLGRQKIWPAKMFSTLAGFVEPGESLEDAVARETWEEAAVRVRDVRYWCSQPWPFPRSVMIGFHARYHSGEATPHPVEMDDVRWFSRQELSDSREMGLRGTPMVPPPVTIARALIDAWLDGNVNL